MAAPAGYRPQLDSLRTLAVAMVAVYHWEHPAISGRELPLGFAGVGLFFVLSGYLITGILLGVDDRRAHRAVPMWHPAAMFYLRRLLRLMPAYYLFLLVVGLSGWLHDPDGLVWYVFYAGNFRAWDRGFDHHVAHLWSLAVEEQFYLLAPLAVFLLNRRTLTWVLLAATVFGLATVPADWIVPPGAFVGLLIGCLTALAADHRPDRLDAAARWWPAGLIGWAVIWVMMGPDGALGPLWGPAHRLCLYVAMAGVVWRAAVGFGGPAKPVLEWQPAVWLGRISYGLYLWHNFAPDLVEVAGFDRAGHGPAVRTAVAAAATVATAAVSWFIVERPLLKLKDRFRYLPAVPPSSLPAPSPSPSISNPPTEPSLSSSPASHRPTIA